MRASELEESAVDELKRKLPSLTKTDYSTIDRLMKRISRKHKITGKKLHDMFVAKYHHTPDHWIKAYKDKLGETDSESFAQTELEKGKMIVLYKDNQPLFKFRNKNDALVSYNELRTEYPDSKIYMKVVNDTGTLYEEVEKSDTQRVQHFIDWANKTLNMQKPYPKIKLSNDGEKAREGHHTGVHDGQEIWVYIGNRNLVDIFRTIFHELVHHRQHQLNMIKDGDSYPGSPIEAMADMMAGKYIKIYGEKHPEIFQ